MTEKTPEAVRRNDEELAKIKAIAESDFDRPVVMLNLNRYQPGSNYPFGALYLEYMDALDRLLPEVGARVLWRSQAHGQIVGEQLIDEVLAVWYPSHAAFIAMPQAAGAKESYRLRAVCVAFAVIHRCDGDTPPLS